MSPIPTSPTMELVRELRANELKNRPQLLNREKVYRREQEDSSNNKRTKASFSVLTFNCLAQGLSNTKEAPFESTGAVKDWRARRAMILEEIVKEKPDLIGLQEIDDFKYFQKQLTSVGYLGHFTPKPYSACLNQPNNIGPDGNAVFYKTSRFRTLRTAKRPLDGRILEDADGYDTNAVASWALLEDVATEDTVAFFTTHLKARKPYAELRAMQAEDLMKCIKRISNGKDVDHIVCVGDFNATPDEPAIGIMSDPKNLLKSAYLDVLEERPSYTTWKKRQNLPEKKACIDYIWFSSKSLRAGAVLQVPTSEQVGADLLPSLAYPSDHVSLWASLSAI